MRGSVTSTFTDPEEFQAATSADRSISFLFTESGRFRARSTEVKLNHLRLVSFEESLPCIAFIRVPPGIVLVGLLIDYTGSPTWGGIRVDNRELITLGAGQCAHMRSEGPCHWGAVLLPAREFTRYGSALTSTAMEIPAAVCRWRPPAAAGSQFRRLLHGCDKNRPSAGRTSHRDGGARAWPRTATNPPSGGMPVRGTSSPGGTREPAETGIDVPI